MKNILKYEEFNEKNYLNNLAGDLIDTETILDMMVSGGCLLKTDIINDQYEKSGLEEHEGELNIPEDYWFNVVDIDGDDISIEFEGKIFNIDIKNVKEIKNK